MHREVHELARCGGRGCGWGRRPAPWPAREGHRPPRSRASAQPPEMPRARPRARPRTRSGRRPRAPVRRRSARAGSGAGSRRTHARVRLLWSLFEEGGGTVCRQREPDRREGAAVQRRRAVADERLAVLLRSIALVAGEAEGGQVLVPGAHQRVAGHLGHDRGRRDRAHPPVALDHRAARIGQPVGAAVAVDEHQRGGGAGAASDRVARAVGAFRIPDTGLRPRRGREPGGDGRVHRPLDRQRLDRRRRPCEPGDGPAHGQQARVEDVQLVDLGHRGRGDAPGRGTLANQPVEPLALGGAEALGVVEPVDRPPRVEHDRRGHDRPRQRPAAHLVDPGDREGGEVGCRRREASGAEDTASGGRTQVD